MVVQVRLPQNEAIMSYEPEVIRAPSRLKETYKAFTSPGSTAQSLRCRVSSRQAEATLTQLYMGFTAKLNPVAKYLSGIHPFTYIVGLVPRSTLIIAYFNALAGQCPGVSRCLQERAPRTQRNIIRRICCPSWGVRVSSRNPLHNVGKGNTCARKDTVHRYLYAHPTHKLLRCTNLTQGLETCREEHLMRRKCHTCRRDGIHSSGNKFRFFCRPFHA